MIVDRIQRYLTTEGRNVEEALLKEVSDLAAIAFARQFGLRRESQQKAPYFSSIGKCLRQQAYNLLGFEPNGKEIDSRSKMVFFMGDMVEVAIIQVAKQAGCDITECGIGQEPIEIDGMRGRPDGILHDLGDAEVATGALIRAPSDYVVEVKSMSSYSFRDFERGVIDDSYRYQCSAAMMALKLTKTVIVGLNKDAGVLHEQVISQDPEIVKDIQARLAELKTITKEALPIRPYRPNEKGLLPWNCLYCNFWRTCWPKAEKVLVSGKYKLRANKKEPLNAPTPA